MRQIVLRTSFVLGRDGGALRRLAKLARCGLGGTVGHGRQGIGWIPNPVSNATFMRELREAVGATIGLPAAAWMVRLAAPLVLRTDPELALYGRYCISRRLQEEGFEFQFPDLPSALKDLYRRDTSHSPTADQASLPKTHAAP